MKKNDLNTSFIPAAVQLAQTRHAQSAVNWLSDYRLKHIEQLSAKPFPNNQQEHFKYNRLPFFDEQDFCQTIDLEAVKQAAEKIKKPAALLPDSDCAVFVDGQLMPQLSQLSQHRFTAFSDASKAQQQRLIQLLETQDCSSNLFSVLNAAHSHDGLFIEVDENSPAVAIEIIELITEHAEQTTLTTQIVIDIAKNSRAKVIWRSASQAKNPVLATHRLLANVAENAQLSHYHLQLEDDNILSFGNVQFNLFSQAELNTFCAATGSDIKKTDITVNHLGEHTHAFVNGLYVANEQQQVDYHTTINHPLPNGQTDEVFRGIISGKAEGVFNGRIHISQDAQKTRAELSNKNLLLSDEAIVHTKPELEIYADDVICAHGATVSRMDSEAMNYLLCRGISSKEAEYLLSHAFFDELIQALEHQEIIDYLRPILFKWF